MEKSWQASKSKMRDRGAYILKTGLFHDVEFLVGSEENVKLISAHKLILSMGSPVFHAMFQFRWKANGPISIPDITPDIFSKMLKYIYSDELDFGDVEDVLKLYHAADKYLVTELKRECHKYFEYVLLFPENICYVLETTRMLGIENLEKRCLTYISVCTKHVLESQGFLKAKQETVQMILEMNEVTVDSEADFFYALLSWVRTECNRNNVEQNPTNMKKIMEPLLPYILFWNIPSRELRNIMNCVGDIFDCEETFKTYTKRAFRKSKFYRGFPKLCIESQNKRIISPDSLLKIALRKDSCPDSTLRVTHATIPTTTMYLEASKNNLVIKGIAFYWIGYKEREDERCSNSKPAEHCLTIHAINLSTDVEVNTKITLTGTDIKLVFGNFIRIGASDTVKFVIGNGIKQFENCMWFSNGRFKATDFIPL